MLLLTLPLHTGCFSILVVAGDLVSNPHRVNPKLKGAGRIIPTNRWIWKIPDVLLHNDEFVNENEVGQVCPKVLVDSAATSISGFHPDSDCCPRLIAGCPLVQC